MPGPTTSTPNTWDQDYDLLKNKWIEKAKQKNPEIEKEIASITSMPLTDPNRRVKAEEFITKHGDIFLPEEEQQASLNERYGSFQKGKEELFTKHGINTKTTSDPEGKKFGTRHLFYQDYIKQTPPPQEASNETTLDYRTNPMANKNHNVVINPATRETIYDFNDQSSINSFIADLKAGKQRKEIPGAYWDPTANKIRIKHSQVASVKPVETSPAVTSTQNQSVFTKHGGVSGWYNKRS